MKIIKSHYLYLLISSTVLFIYFYNLLDAGLFAEDLPAHAEIVRRMLETKSLFFYDRFWFSGWPVFQFYGFLPHLLTLITSLVLFDVYSIESIIRFYSLLACCALPFSFYFATRRLTKTTSFSTSVIIGFITFWFLLLDEAFYGLGIKSILGVGLFPQVFGWHLILIGIGLILQNSRALALIFATSLVTHTLSGFFLILFSLIWFVLTPQSRKNIAISLLIALGMLSFWLIPFLKYSAEYSSADVYQDKRDWLSLLFRYPLTEFKLSKITECDLFRLIFLFALAYFAAFYRKINSENVIKLIIAILLLSLFSNSNYLAASNPLAMHYYRVSGLILFPVLLLVIFSLSSLASINKYASLSIMLLLTLAAFNLHRLEKDSFKPAKIKVEHTAVIELIKNDSTVGRVFVEYNTDYQQMSQYSAHYLESKLSPVEVLNGLFVESSNLNRYIAFSADILDAGTFHGYLLFINGSNIDRATALKQLQSLGVTKIVASSKKFIENLKALLGSPIYQNASYQIFDLGPEPNLLEVNKPVVAYLDLKNELPFSIVSQYFYSNLKLYNNYELVSVTKKQLMPSAKYLMINGDKESILKFLSANKSDAQVIPFYEQARLNFSHQTKDYPVDNKVEIYKKVKNFFDRKLKLSERLTEIDLTQNTKSAEYEWRGQELVLKNLIKDRLYKLNYSYSPLLISQELRIFRGIAERTYIIPSRDGEHSVKFSYLKLSYLAISITSLIIFIFYRRKNV